MIIIGFFRCACGKLHMASGTIGPNSECKCGRKLFDQMWNKT